MEQQLPLQEKRSDKGFQHISEILPDYMEKLLKRADNPIPDPNDVEASIKWVEENL